MLRECLWRRSTAGAVIFSDANPRAIVYNRLKTKIVRSALTSDSRHAWDQKLNLHCRHRGVVIAMDAIIHNQHEKLLW